MTLRGGKWRVGGFHEQKCVLDKRCHGRKLQRCPNVRAAISQEDPPVSKEPPMSQEPISSEESNARSDAKVHSEEMDSKLRKALEQLSTLKEEEKQPMPQEALNQLLLSLLVAGATNGTIAVVIAFVAKLDPFGNFHWDQSDALVGLGIALPLMVLEAVLMIPDHMKTAKDKSLEAPVMIKAAALYQKSRIENNVPTSFPFALETLIVALTNLGSERLQCAVLLTLASKGIVSYMVLFQGYDLEEAAEPAAWLAVALGTMVTLYLSGLFKKRNARVEMIGMDKVTGQMKRKDMGGEEVNDLIKKDPAAARKLSKSVQMASGSLDVFMKTVGVERVLTYLSSTVSFTYTGNLLAPFIGSFVKEVIFCVYQRVGQERMDAARRGKLQGLAEKVRERLKSNEKAESDNTDGENSVPIDAMLSSNHGPSNDAKPDSIQDGQLGKSVRLHEEKDASH